jgi:iron complex outermembrane receptor protein
MMAIKIREQLVFFSSLLAKCKKTLKFGLNPIHTKSLLTPFVVMAFYPQLCSAEVDDFANLDFEDLLDIEVTSVSRHAKSVMNSAAAIYVINQKDIKRSGATSIPEALRLVPGMYVAQLESGRWVVGTRSFPGRFANKLLVMVDGRSVYTHAFSGVYWESLDMIMEDINRIEVIRGPGATLWGANAVNGVINIITKSAQETQGGYSLVSYGNEQKIASLRYGAKLTENVFAKGYLKYKQYDDQRIVGTNDDSFDESDNLQGGFRIERTLAAGDTVTLKGDIFRHNNDQEDVSLLLTPPYLETNRYKARNEGWNILGRWEKPLTLTSHASLQTSLDRHKVIERAATSYQMTNVEVDFQHHLKLSNRNEFIWGLGYMRNKYEKLSKQDSITISGDEISHDQYSAFIQDEYSIIDNLKLTVGSKFEDNSYTGFEYQPNARILWRPSEDKSIWASVSRSVRTPSLVERSGTINTGILAAGSAPLYLPVPAVTSAHINGTAFESEVHLAYELGYRQQVISTLSIDATAFYSDYKDIRSVVPTSPIFNGSPPTSALIDFIIGNRTESTVHGIELSAKWQATTDWLLSAEYSYSKTNIDSVASDFISPFLAKIMPQQQVIVRSQYDVTANIDTDFTLRYVDRVANDTISINTPNINIDSYIDLDVRLAWRPSDEMTLSVIGKNLLDSQKLENYDNFFNLQQIEIQRSVLVQAELAF